VGCAHMQVSQVVESNGRWVWRQISKEKQPELVLLLLVLMLELLEQELELGWAGVRGDVRNKAGGGLTWVTTHQTCASGPVR
jgi:hypothetical protein